MCMPLGPRGGGSYGRRAFNTINDVISYPIEKATEKYPDNDKAMDKLYAYTTKNISHTLNWMIDDLYSRDRQLLRLAAEPDNLSDWKIYFREQKKSAK